jgi:hypothetical protein
MKILSLSIFTAIYLSCFGLAVKDPNFRDDFGKLSQGAFPTLLALTGNQKPKNKD